MLGLDCSVLRRPKEDEANSGASPPSMGIVKSFCSSGFGAVRQPPPPPPGPQVPQVIVQEMQSEQVAIVQQVVDVLQPPLQFRVMTRQSLLANVCVIFLLAIESREVRTRGTSTPLASVSLMRRALLFDRS